MNRGAWRATVHGVTKSQTQLSGQAQHSTGIHITPFFVFLLIIIPFCGLASINHLTNSIQIKKEEVVFM